MQIDAATWYDPGPDPSGLYQGDIIHDVPIVFMPPAAKRWILLRPNKGLIADIKAGTYLPTAFQPRAEGQASQPWAGGEDLVLAKATRQTVVLLNQTCDLDNRKHVQCAPVYLITGGKPPADMLEIIHKFPFPNDGEFPACFAELGAVTSVHVSYAKQAKVVKRLSPFARSFFQLKLARFYGRPFGFTSRDNVPQDWDYICMTCFLRGSTQVRQRMATGAKFPPCSQCGEDVLWTKLLIPEPLTEPRPIEGTIARPPQEPDDDPRSDEDLAT